MFKKMSKIFSDSNTKLKKLTKIGNNFYRKVLKRLLGRQQIYVNEIKNPKCYLMQQQHQQQRPMTINNSKISNFKKNSNFSLSKYSRILHLNNFNLKSPEIFNSIRNYSEQICCHDDEKPKISIVGNPCIEYEPMSCKDCKYDEDPHIMAIRQQTEGVLNCFCVPKPANGRCYNKRTPWIRPVPFPTREYSTVVKLCHGECARNKEDIQKLRNMTEGCCIGEKKPCKKKVKMLISKNPTNHVSIVPCTIPTQLRRPIMSKLWEERGCTDLRIQTEGPPCRSKCSSIRLPACDARSRNICEVAQYLYLCKKTECPHPSFSECTDPPLYKDIHECTYCPRTITPPWVRPPSAEPCPTCQKNVCKPTWSTDKCVLKRLNILYRNYVTQAGCNNFCPAPIQNIKLFTRKYMTSSYLSKQKYPDARKINPLVEERCYAEKCKELDREECENIELQAKYCRPKYPNTYTCVLAKPSEGNRCVVNVIKGKCDKDAVKSTSKLCSKVCSE